MQQHPLRNTPGAAVSDYLQQHDALARLLPTARLLTAIQTCCEQQLSHQFAGCHVVGLENEALVITAPHQAAASRLRQKLPSLQQFLFRSGWKITHIRIKIKPGTPAAVTPVSGQKRQLSAQAATLVQNLHLQLADTPDNLALKSVLERLAKRHRPESGC